MWFKKCVLACLSFLVCVAEGLHVEFTPSSTVTIYLDDMREINYSVIIDSSEDYKSKYSFEKVKILLK